MEIRRLDLEKAKLEDDRRWREREKDRFKEKDQEEEKVKSLLTSRAKPYFDTFKNILHKLPNEPAEVIGYFDFL